MEKLKLPSCASLHWLVCRTCCSGVRSSDMWRISSEKKKLNERRRWYVAPSIIWPRKGQAPGRPEERRQTRFSLSSVMNVAFGILHLYRYSIHCLELASGKIAVHLQVSIAPLFHRREAAVKTILKTNSSFFLLKTETFFTYKNNRFKLRTRNQFSFAL